MATCKTIKCRISIKLYEPSMRDELKSMLEMFSKEVYDSSGENVNIDDFVNFHQMIYIVMVDDRFAGFTSFVINSYYGMRESTVGNDYIYVKPQYRRTKAMHYVSLQAGAVCKDLGMNLEHYYVEDSKSMPFIGRLEGKKLYNVYEFSVDSVQKECNRMKLKIYKKDI